jgi:hypothetical protein
MKKPYKYLIINLNQINIYFDVKIITYSSSLCKYSESF